MTWDTWSTKEGKLERRYGEFFLNGFPISDERASELLESAAFGNDCPNGTCDV